MTFQSGCKYKVTFEVLRSGTNSMGSFLTNYYLDVLKFSWTCIASYSLQAATEWPLFRNYCWEKSEENETKQNQFPPSQLANTDMKCFKSYKDDSANTTELWTKSFTHTMNTLKGWISICYIQKKHWHFWIPLE